MALENPAWSFVGSDISSSNFPARENLPANVELQEFDALAELPAHLEGRFDVVHVRAVCLVIKGDDPSPFLQNMLRLLSKFLHLKLDQTIHQVFESPNPSPSPSGCRVCASWRYSGKALPSGTEQADDTFQYYVQLRNTVV